MALHPTFDKLKDNILCYFRPPLQASPQSQTLMDEDLFGRSQLHRHMEYLIPQLCSMDKTSVVAEIDRYDIYGRTPLMTFLVQCSIKTVPHQCILATAQDLIKCGANIHARSREGATVVHYAARRALPDVLKYILEAGGEVNHRDTEGYCALDYAADTLNMSRSKSSLPLFTALAMKTIILLLDNGAESAFVPATETHRLRNVLNAAGPETLSSGPDSESVGICFNS
ncbi:hypothetical protein K491DRAFT_782843 [Lophiostoma macrostomum CBS 122681]|uniref:Uncharacterized protein n=1 Tax=Lophiostoma macrostomum CBS 122681 TaxID=1314788 RepID=A0A6A6SRI5_9PLEO|nr:hypothetical protein K491DRAFT_782843 [Lophiostoma macrostomum CBS 122681]